MVRDGTKCGNDKVSRTSGIWLIRTETRCSLVSISGCESKVTITITLWVTNLMVMEMAAVVLIVLVIVMVVAVVIKHDVMAMELLPAGG